MKKQNLWKRMTAFALCLVLLFSVGVQAYAGDAQQDVFFLCRDNDELQCTVLILDYNSAFTQIGDVPQVQLTNGGDVTIISEDSILRELHETRIRHTPGKKDAQLFIRLPAYLRDGEENAIPTSAVLSVSAGAFRTEAGEPSPAVSMPLKIVSASRVTWDWEYVEHIACGTAVLPRTVYHSANPFFFSSSGGIRLQKEIEIAEGTKISFEACHWGWDIAEMQFMENGQLLAQPVTAQTLGRHTVRVSINDFVYEDISYAVVTPAEARLANLWALGIESLRGVYMVPFGLAVLIYPGVGTFLGGNILLEWWNAVSSFFAQLFSRDLQDTIPVKFYL